MTNPAFWPHYTFMKQQYFTRFTAHLLFLFTLWSLPQTTQAQDCIGPYHIFEGGDALANLTTKGWEYNITLSTNATNSYSGTRFFQYSTAAGRFLRTPEIVNPSRFSFYYRTALATTTNWGIRVDYSTDPNFGTFTTIFSNGSATTGVGAYTLVDLDLVANSVPNNVYIRIINTNTGVVWVDDIGVTSTVPSENLTIVPKKGTTVCTHNLLSGLVYNFYDNAGPTDNYSTAQNNTVTFMPAAGEQIELKFITFNTVATSTGNITVTNADAPLNAYTGTVIPTPSLYNSVAGNGSITTQFITSGSNGAGYHIEVRSKPAVATCSNVLTPAIQANSQSASGATLTWTQPAALPSLGYQYFISTSNTTPLASATPTGASAYNTTSTVVNTLSPNTTYYAWVRSNCDTLVGDWVYAGTFGTLCSAYSVPYLEDFNGLNGPLPVCTSQAAPGQWSTNIVNGNLFTNTNGAMFFTKPVTLTAGVLYRLTYDYRTLTNTADFTVYYGRTTTRPTAMNINNLLFEHIGVSTTIESNIVRFTPTVSGTHYIGFSLDDLTGAAFNLDNIILVEEDCFAPTALVGSNPTASTSSGNVSWTQPSSLPVGGYQYFIGTTPAYPSFNSTPSGTFALGTDATIFGLASNTTYYVWIRSNCGGTFSDWSSTYATFTTAVIPAAVVVEMSTGSSTGCNFNFFDSNANTSTIGNYNNFEDFTRTFTAGTPGSQLKVEFSAFATENNYDGLMIYDGPNTASPLISSGLGAGTDPINCPAGSFRGTGSPGTIYSTSGSLTFRFTSDYLVTRSGWAATVTCVTLPTISSFNPPSNNCGTETQVTINGTNFTGVTGVTIGGVPVTIQSATATQLVVNLNASVTGGPIRVSNSQATATSSTSFVVQAPPPVTTGALVCAGQSGVLTTSTVCPGYFFQGNTINGAFNYLTDATAPKPSGSTNSTTCSFTSTVLGYTATLFQVSVTGTYQFEMNNATGYDAMGYIAAFPFTPGTCNSNFVVGDDDSGPGLFPAMSGFLQAGVTYVLYTTTFGTIANNTNTYTWTVTSSAGQLLQAGTPEMRWYAAASGGSPIFVGNSFNPVGVSGSGLTDTLTPGTYTFYAACISNPDCRTATVFEIQPGPAVTITPSTTVCANAVLPLTASGTASTYTWTSTVPGSLFSDALGTVPYIDGTSTTSVYLRTPVTATVTVTGTASLTGCPMTATANYSLFTKIWNGSAWNGNGLPPTATESMFFNGNFTTTGNMQGCSCTVGSGNVVVSSGHTLSLLNALHVTGGSLTFQNNASLYQVNPVTNTGNITYLRSTTPMILYDYTYWSSPVSGQRLLDMSPQTTTARFYTFNPVNNTWAFANPTTTFMAEARGYIVRAPQNFSTTVPAIYTAPFVGVPRNGDYSHTITLGMSESNLIGNPYPSALNADLFLSDPANTCIDPTIYLWTHNTPIASNNYAANDYATYNYFGGVGTGTPVMGSNNATPNGRIASGQGFFVKAVSNGSVQFRNTMRVVGQNSQFFRMSGSTEAEQGVSERHRIWLDISNTQGAYKQTLLGYAQAATSGRDPGYDGDLFEGSTVVSLYTLLNDQKMVTQAKGLPFDAADVWPLGYRSTIAGTFQIALSDFDGLFEGQSIYLEDRVTGVVHDLKSNPYAFVTESGTYHERFVLRFTPVTLGLGDSAITATDFLAYKEGMALHVASQNVAMERVTLYDLRGRTLATQKVDGLDRVVFANLALASQMLLVQIQTTTGETFTLRALY